MIRQCYNCGLNLNDQPALRGLKGVLCFPCLYNFDIEGGERYLEGVKNHEREFCDWQNTYGKIWPKCEYLGNISRKLSIICAVTVFLSILFMRSNYKKIMLIFPVIGISVIANRLLKRKIDSYGCPPMPTLKESKRSMIAYEPEIIFDDCCVDINPELTQIEYAYPPDWAERKNKCLSRDDSRCRLCGTIERLHVHHVKPISYGGIHSLQNLIVLCRFCHMKQKYFSHSLLVHHNIRANVKYIVKSHTRYDGVTIKAHTRKIGRRGKFWRDIKKTEGRNSD